MYHPYSGGECPTQEVRFPPKASASRPSFDVHVYPPAPDQASPTAYNFIGDAPVSVGYENLDDILEYDGLRPCVRRSSTSKTGACIGRTAEDGFLPRRMEHESMLERTFLIHMLQHPNTLSLKCQPLKITFRKKIANRLSNTLDFLVTLKTGQKSLVFVRNKDSLSRAETSLIINEIKVLMPEGYGLLIVSEENYPPQVRGNYDRFFLAKRFPDPEADAGLARVLSDTKNTAMLTIEELVVRCNFGPTNEDQGRAFQAVLRAIVDRVLETDHNLLICYSSVVSLIG